MKTFYVFFGLSLIPLLLSSQFKNENKTMWLILQITWAILYSIALASAFYHSKDKRAAKKKAQK